METNQTAIEWLKNSLEQHGSQYRLDLDWESIDKLFEQALAMEKEQIMDDFQEGKWDWHAKLNEGKESKDPAEYYNETYGK